MFHSTVKPALSGHSKRRPKLVFQQYELSLNAGQKYRREHSVILSTFIKLPFVFKTFFCLFLNGRLRHVLLYIVLVSLDNLYKEVGWQTLHRRRQDHKITLFYKMFNQLTPVYLSSLIPQQVNAISHHNLRNSNDIHTIRSNTSLYHNSFLPSTLRQWNSLPVEVRQLNTLSSFKTFLKKDLQSVPTYYYCGSRKAQILHARLRTGCISLNMDLFHKNITESPLCRCGSIEDTQHYFFHCRFYQGPRNTFECLYFLPESFPKSPPLWKFNTIT